VATPLGFVLSLVGVLTNKDRRAGVWGLILTGALLAWFILTNIC
jgi:hypothetical protein